MVRCIAAMHLYVAFLAFSFSVQDFHSGMYEEKKLQWEFDTSILYFFILFLLCEGNVYNSVKKANFVIMLMELLLE